MRDVKARLLDILEAINNIERYVEKGREEFENNELIQTWFFRQLEIIGEAVRALPDEILNFSPQIPWAGIIGMRNILAHGYFEIDKDVVWNTVQNDIPTLKYRVEEIIAIVDRSPGKF